MLGINDLDVILRKMDDSHKFDEFIYYAFDYKIDSNFKEYFVQHIEGDIILYIYEKKETHNLFTLEFTYGNCDVYMDKSYYKNTFVNTVYVNKCLENYDDNYDNKIINYCKAMNANSLEEQIKLLKKTIPSYIVDIMYK